MGCDIMSPRSRGVLVGCRKGWWVAFIRRGGVGEGRRLVFWTYTAQALHLRWAVGVVL